MFSSPRASTIRLLIPFLAAVALVAGLVTLSLLWVVQWGTARRLPVMSGSELAVSGYRHDTFREYYYEGDILRPDGLPDRVSVIPAAPQAIRMQLWLGNSAGTSMLAGTVGADTGVFCAGPLSTHEARGGTYRVDGQIRGPALVEGVPTVHLEATVRLGVPDSPGSEGPAVRRWSVQLRATGRTHL